MGQAELTAAPGYTQWSEVTCKVTWEDTDISTENNTSRMRLTGVYFKAHDSKGFEYWTQIRVEVGGKELFDTGKWPLLIGYIPEEYGPNLIEEYLEEQDYYSEPLPHKDDGSLDVSIAVGDEVFIGWSQSIVAYRFEGSGQAEEVPRASGISMEAVELGKQATIRLDRKASRFRDTVTWECGSRSGTLMEKGESLEKIWYVPISLAEEEKNKPSVEVKLMCSTYDGDNLIGNRETTVQLPMPGSIAPFLQFLWAEDRERLADDYDQFIQGMSMMIVRADCEKAYGAEIEKCVITFDGESYEAEKEESADPERNQFRCLTKRIASAGDLVMKAEITDSRGRKDSSEATIHITEYKQPELASFLAFRSDRLGNEDDQGSYITIQAVGTISQIGEAWAKKQNAMQILAGISGSGGGWEERDITSSGSCTLYASPAGIFTARVRVTDDFSQTERRMKIPTVYATIDLLPEGKGVAFGGMCQGEGAEFYMPVKILGGMYIGEKTLEQYINDLIGGK